MGNCSGKPDTLDEDVTGGRIQVVVLLCLEGRSFDNMLGLMQKINPGIDGLSGDESCPVSVEDINGPKITVSTGANYVDANDLDLKYESIKRQMYGLDKPATVENAKMSGFVAVAEAKQKGLGKMAMSAFTPDQLPVYKKLAQEFAVFDRWYSSVPAPSHPNRLFLHSATSAGILSNEGILEQSEGLPGKTIFDSLASNNNSFGVYYQSIPSVLAFKNLREPKYMNSFKVYKDFKADAANGTLPNYVVIEPRYFGVPNAPQNNDHAPADVREGQKLVKEVYETLRKSPQWNQTLLVITYDSHGAFYDHVPPPTSFVPNPDSKKGPAPEGFNFDRLGVRVPTIVVSPWIEKYTVMREPHPLKGNAPTAQFEHSSIPATIKKLFGLPDFLSERDAWAGTLDRICNDRKSPRTDCPLELALPDDVLSAPIVSGDVKSPRVTSNPGISKEQHVLVKLAALINNDTQSFNKSIKVWTQQSAHEYVDRNVKTFFQRLRTSQSAITQIPRGAPAMQELS